MRIEFDPRDEILLKAIALKLAVPPKQALKIAFQLLQVIVDHQLQQHVIVDDTLAFEVRDANTGDPVLHIKIPRTR